MIEGQRAKFDCFLTGQPEPTIRWLHNGIPLDLESNTRKYSSQIHSNGKVTLTIEDCLQEDAGEITIIAQNRAGSTQCSAELTVEGETFLLTESMFDSILVLPCLAHQESDRLKRRVSFDLPESAANKFGAIPSSPSRLLLTPDSKSSLNLSWDHSSSHSRAQPCTYIVELRDPRTYSWSTYASLLSGASPSIVLHDVLTSNFLFHRFRYECSTTWSQLESHLCRASSS